MQFNLISGNPIFSGYASSGQTAVALYLDEGSNNHATSATFFADEVNSEKGNNAEGSCLVVYEFLTSVYNRLSSEAKTIFDTSEDEAFVNARNRIAYLSPWILVHPSGFSRIETPRELSSTIMATLIIGLMVISSLVGY